MQYRDDGCRLLSQVLVTVPAILYLPVLIFCYATTLTFGALIESNHEQKRPPVELLVSPYNSCSLSVLAGPSHPTKCQRLPRNLRAVVLAARPSLVHRLTRLYYLPHRCRARTNSWELGIKSIKSRDQLERRFSRTGANPFFGQHVQKGMGWTGSSFPMSLFDSIAN